MARITIATVNGEGMNDWFTQDAEAPDWKATFSPDGVVNDTHVTAGRLGALIRSLNADVVAVQEGPSRLAELGLFVDRYLANAGQPLYRHFLGDTGAPQKVGLLYKP